MRRSQLSPWTLRAITVTGGFAEFGDERAPTWDGRSWHLARLTSEENVLHEIAHWIVADPAHRGLVNYGLGTDPDGGPYVAPSVVSDILRWPREARGSAAALARSSPDTFVAIVKEKLDLEEELATVLTIFLLRHAERPWVARAKKIFAPFLTTEKTLERFWWLAGELVRRGVDVNDPLASFERGTDVRAAAPSLEASP